jgi:hypothetical protein
MRTDGRTNGLRTDMTKLIVPFRNFAKAPNNGRAFVVFIQVKYSGNSEMYRIAPYETRLSNVILFRDTKFAEVYLTFLL